MVRFPDGLLQDAATHLPVTEVILPDPADRSNDREPLINTEYEAAGVLESRCRFGRPASRPKGGSRPEIEIVR